jgi:hypothetical protein
VAVPGSFEGGDLGGVGLDVVPSHIAQTPTNDLSWFHEQLWDHGG